MRVVVENRIESQRRAQLLEFIVGRAQQRSGEIAFDLLEPLFPGVRCFELAQVIQAIGEARQQDAAGDVGELAALRDHGVVVVPGAQLVHHFVAVLFERTDRQAIRHDHEVGRRPNGCERRDPSALALAHQADRHAGRIEQFARVADGGECVVGELTEIDREAAGRLASAALVVDECSDAVKGQQVLHVVVGDRAVLTGAVNKHDESLRLLGCEQLAVQRVADAREGRRRLRHRDALRGAGGSILETELHALPGAAVEYRFGDARLARRPTGSAVEMLVVIRIEAPAAAVRHAITQCAFVARRNDYVVAAGEPVRAGVTGVRRSGLGTCCERRCCCKKCNCTEEKSWNCHAAASSRVNVPVRTRQRSTGFHSVFFVDFPSIAVVHFVPSSDISHLYVYAVGELSTIV